ncbi:MAG: hypothetical protein EOO03_08405, partial [Chitinophagaceae bacterium]
LNSTPQRAILLSNLASQVNKKKKKTYCHNHPEKRAIGVCLEERQFLCAVCRREGVLQLHLGSTNRGYVLNH